MSALGLVAVLIGHIVDGVGLSIVAQVGVEAAHSERILIGSQMLKLTLFLVRFAVARLHAK